MDEAVNERNGTMRKNNDRHRYTHRDVQKLITATDAYVEKVVEI